MEIVELFLSILSVIIGYLLGAILPAFLFGKLKGIDVREEGTKNPGTTNAFKVLGLPYAILTALYDTLKGLLAMMVAFSLGVNPIFWQISGLMAIVESGSTGIKKLCKISGGSRECYCHWITPFLPCKLSYHQF